MPPADSKRAAGTGWELADIFREFGESYRRTHAVPASQLKVMRAIEVCRTAELGGHLERCTACGFERPAYNSCRNRHCPKCQGLATPVAEKANGRASACGLLSSGLHPAPPPQPPRPGPQTAPAQLPCMAGIPPPWGPLSRRFALYNPHSPQYTPPQRFSPTSFIPDAAAGPGVFALCARHQG